MVNVGHVLRGSGSAVLMLESEINGFRTRDYVKKELN